MNTEKKLSYVDWVDAAKGFAIFLVVIGHTWGGLHAKRMTLDSALFINIDSRIYAFHMPLFFMLSGLFFAGSMARSTAKDLVKTRFSRLLYPMLLWTYIFILAKMAAGAMANTPLDASELFKSPIPGRWHFWFLWALLLIQLALIPLRRFLIDPTMIHKTSAALFAVLLVIQFVPFSSGVYYWAGQAIQMMPYFVLGIALGPWVVPAAIPPVFGALAGFVFAITLIAVPWLGDGVFERLWVGMVLSVSCLIIFATWFKSGKWAPHWLVPFGQASMAIYLTHTIFSATLREILFAVGLEEIFINLVLGTLIGILPALVLYALVRRLNVAKFVGF